jgi:DNA helicase-2/ATP-dependent DNA helicase PcrA
MGLVTSPRLRGEVGAKRRVRGILRESESVERAPHPNPLPVKNGERGQWPIAATPPPNFIQL